MSDDNVTLRAPDPADREALLAWRADPENGRLLMWRTGAKSLADVDAWIARRTVDPDGHFSVIARRSDAVGFVQLTRIDRVDGHGYLGLFIASAERGRGAASTALRLMEQQARAMGLRKLMLEVLGDNPLALRFWTVRGYGVVGRLRQHHEHGGRHHDVLVLEKLLVGGPPPTAIPPSTSTSTFTSSCAAHPDLPAPGPSPIPNEAALIQAMAADPQVRELRAQLMSLMGKYKYAYNWTWYGRPIIQLPQDVLAMQMLILDEKPDLIIETGIAHGGSLVLSASLLELLGQGQVLGIDVDIRPHNRAAIEAHPLAHRISLIQGSSIAPEVADQVRARARLARRVMVCLDSNHTATHVAHELALYAPLVTAGQHLVVFDTAIEDLPQSDFPDRPWGPGNSPKTAVHAFLAQNPEFQIDRQLEARLLFTVAPDGYLKRTG